MFLRAASAVREGGMHPGSFPSRAAAVSPGGGGLTRKVKPSRYLLFSRKGEEDLPAENIDQHGRMWGAFPKWGSH